MSEKQQRARKNKMTKNREKLRHQLWPDVKDDDLWISKTSSGFTQMPRTMPHILRIMDDKSKGTPLSSTYFALWCRIFDQSVITIDNIDAIAFESGFSGERAVTTLKNRMRKLEELGFISLREGVHDFSFVLVYNPHAVILKLKECIQDNTYNVMYARALEVGCKDFTE